MNICCCGDFKNRTDEGESECVTHGIDEDIRDEGGDCLVCEDYGAERLTEHGEVRVSGGGNPVPSI